MPTPSKKNEKHPRELTTQEAIEHLFHPQAIEHAKKKAERPVKPRKQKP